MNRTLGLDIGGANLKLACGDDFATSARFALWKHPHELATAVGKLLDAAPATDRVALTMTGELADCFATKREGVEHILGAAQQAVGDRELLVYALPGAFLDVSAAGQQPEYVAASNWHALAAAVATRVEGSPLMVIDTGSTTTDVMPVVEGKVAAVGKNDPERLLAGELVYAGVRRSPVCAMAPALPWQGQPCPTARVLFATAVDAFVWTGDIAEDESDLETADGRPATRSFARDRLARSICADRELFSDDDALNAAMALKSAQAAKIGLGARQVLRRLGTPPTALVISGSGEFLARDAALRLRLNAPIHSLAEMLGADVSNCAAAWAVSVLADRDQPRG